MIGGVIGLVTLLFAFLLPFSAIAEGPGGSPDTLIGIFKLFVTTLSNIQAVGLTQLTELAYVYMAAFVLIMVSGIIAAYPRWAVIFGVVGMAMVTIAPFAIFPNYDFLSSNYSYGFYGIWVTTLALIAAVYLSTRERAKNKAGPAPVVPASPQPQKPSPAPQ